MKNYFSKQLLSYEHVYSTKPPIDRISIIKSISKNTLLLFLGRMNLNLTKNYSSFYDDGIQQKIFDCFFVLSHLNREIFIKSWKLLEKEDGERGSKSLMWLIFTRETCLFAIEEVVNSDLLKNIDNYTLNEADRIAILDYILAVNYALLSAQAEQDEHFQKISKSNTPGSIAYDLNTLEYINSKMLILNELSVDVTPINTFYRGYKLMEYLLEHPKYQDKVKAYFRDIYDVEPAEFLFYILELSIEYENVNLSFVDVTDSSHDYINVNECFNNKKYEDFINVLSTRINNKNTYNMLS